MFANLISSFITPIFDKVSWQLCASYISRFMCVQWLGFWSIMMQNIFLWYLNVFNAGPVQWTRVWPTLLFNVHCPGFLVLLSDFKQSSLRCAEFFGYIIFKIYNCFKTIFICQFGHSLFVYFFCQPKGILHIVSMSGKHVTCV